MEFDWVMGCGMGWFVGPKFILCDGLSWVGLKKLDSQTTPASLRCAAANLYTAQNYYSSHSESNTLYVFDIPIVHGVQCSCGFIPVLKQ